MNLVYIEYDFIVYLVKGNWNDFLFICDGVLKLD